jgi:hypothetical protein
VCMFECDRKCVRLCVSPQVVSSRL